MITFEPMESENILVLYWGSWELFYFISIFILNKVKKGQQNYFCL